MLRIRFKKRADAYVALTCIRDDGTRTSSTLGAAGGYGPVHDLTHFVVETSMGLTGGFLGLLARGWDIQDFESGAAARIAREPDAQDAATAEILSGLLSGEAMNGTRADAEELNWSLREIAGKQAAGWDPPILSDEELTLMRDRLGFLRGEWDALRPGDTLELQFEPGAVREPEQRSPVSRAETIRGARR